MPFTRPGQIELGQQAVSTLESASGIAPLPGRGVLRALAQAIAGVRHLLHGHLDWVYRQLFPTTAESSELDEWARIKGVQARQGPVSASGFVIFTGSENSAIPAGSQVTRTDGVIYATQADAAITTGVAIINSIAVTPGAAGNVVGGTPVTLLHPIPGIDQAASVESNGMAGGSDAESDESLRTRLLQSFAFPGQGGSEADYVRWAREVPGVTRAWCIPSMFGAGTVGVTFATDLSPLGPIPSAAKVAEVQAYIDPLDPVNAILTVFAPTPLPIDIEITDLEPSTVDVKAAIAAALQDLITAEATPGKEFVLSHIDEAISSANGEQDHILTLPSVNVVVANTQLPVLGEITYLG